MATSNSRDFISTSQTIIQDAFKVLGQYGIRATPEANDHNFAVRHLNRLIKMYSTGGMKLWNRQQATLFTAYQTASYSLGSTGTHATKSYVSTALNGAHIATDTTLVVDSTTGMTAADFIGIELTDGTRQWTTIVSVDSATGITVTTGLTGAASDNATVVTYTTKISRPLQVRDARWFNLTTNNESALTLIHYDEYMAQSDKTTNSDYPSVAMYDKQMTNGVMYLWPRPSNVNNIIKFTMHELTEDVDSNSDNIDFPVEWELAIQFQLAVLLAYPYGQYQKIQPLKAQADEYLARVENFNADEEPTQFVPRND